MEDKEQKGWAPFFAGQHFHGEQNSRTENYHFQPKKNVLLCVQWNRDSTVHVREAPIAQEKMR